MIPSRGGRGCFVFKEKLKRLKEKLKVWNKESFGQIDKKIATLKGEIEKLDILDDTFGLEEYEIVRRNEASAILIQKFEQKAKLQAQKAKVRWLKEGDVNSSFFHRAIVQRRKKAEIQGLFVGDEWTEDPRKIKESVKNHFENQFRSKQRIKVTLPSDLTNKKIKSEEKDWLIRKFSENEVKEAVWECDSDKSPGPDGFNFHFVKASWDIINYDLLKVLEEFHSNGRFIKGSNSSFITLIPKKEGASTLNDYMPISLIGCLYKIVAKVLAKRMACVMDSIISDCQSAFVGGRIILDGVVILNEIIEEANRKKMKRAILKVDFAKAYDTIECEFVDKMLERFDFPILWRKWVKGCLSSTTASVLINGVPSGEFKLEIGIRQGDSLSPFIFLVVAEGLHLLLERAVACNIIKPVKVGKDNIEISHLQYADDTILISPAGANNAWGFRCVLKLFQLVSGLTVNYDKSNLVGIGMEEGEILEMANRFGCLAGSLPINYLDIKIGTSLSRVVNWKYIVDKIQRKISGWKNQMFSFGDRITLVRSVLLATPLHQISFSIIPIKIVREINFIVRIF